MKLLILRITNELDMEKVLVQLANHKLVDSVIIDAKGMASELNDYHGSLLGSLRAMFDLDREVNKLILLTCEDNQVQYAVQAMEKVVGDIEESESGDYIISLPIDFIKKAKRWALRGFIN